MRQMQTNKYCASLNLLLSLKKKIFSLSLDYLIHFPPFFPLLAHLYFNYSVD